MKRTFAALALLACLLLPPGCIRPPNDDEADYFPLTIGSVWEFELLELRITPDSTDTLSRGTVKWEAKAETQLGNGQPAVLLELTEDGFVDTIYYRATDEAVMLHEDPDDDEPLRILSLPLAADLFWYVDEDVRALVVDREERTVRAGRYRNCWKVSWVEDGDLVFNYWYAPNVGLCFGELDEEYQGTRFVERMELVSVNIK